MAPYSGIAYHDSDNSRCRSLPAMADAIERPIEKERRNLMIGKNGES